LKKFRNVVICITEGEEFLFSF